MATCNHILDSSVLAILLQEEDGKKVGGTSREKSRKILDVKFTVLEKHTHLGGGGQGGSGIEPENPHHLTACASFAQEF